MWGKHDEKKGDMRKVRQRRGGGEGGEEERRCTTREQTLSVKKNNTCETSLGFENYFVLQRQSFLNRLREDHTEVATTFDHR